MRKKLDTRFPAARIKKIMQADEEVGKIAMATPVLISKALELFLQDLCDRTYDITLKRGAKTMNSHHLKECVHSHSVFDFLRESVSRVPDLDPESAGGGDNGRRRKAVDGDNDESCEEDLKRPRSASWSPRSEVDGVPSRGRGRGRGRGRRRNRQKTRTAEATDKAEDNEAGSSPQLSDDCDANSPKSQQQAEDTSSHQGETSGFVKDSTKDLIEDSRFPKDFDLNMGLNENGEVNNALEKEAEAEYHSEWLGGRFPGLNPSSTLLQDHNVFQPEEEEDYDCEDED